MGLGDGQPRRLPCLYASTDLHPGLIELPATGGSTDQRRLVGEVIDWIETAACSAGWEVRDTMINHVLARDDDGVWAAVTTDVR
jgi:hypothetical protein